jgi:hypothetical protein
MTTMNNNAPLKRELTHKLEIAQKPSKKPSV